MLKLQALIVLCMHENKKVLKHDWQPTLELGG
jgi:hypothetical protein